MENGRSFLGRGWQFPPQFDKVKGGVRMVSDMEDIAQSLEILLSTSLGERIMLPDYGCNLQEMIFEPLNTSIKTYIAELVKTAILHYEPRIIAEGVQVEELADPGSFLISIDFRPIGTNSRFNYVFPYYQQEGIEVKY